MNKKIKHIFVGILIGVIALPTITLGGTFVSSLIQGKTVEKAVQILATQIDSLIGRVGILESGQEQIAQELQKQEACRKVGDILDQANDVFRTATVKTIDNAIFYTQIQLGTTDSIDQEVISILQTRIIKLQDLKVEQLAQEAICEQLDSEQIIKKESCRRADWILKKLKDLPKYKQIIAEGKESDYYYCDQVEQQKPETENDNDEMIQEPESSNDFFREYQTKINQLQELEIEYHMQKELCEQP